MSRLKIKSGPSHKDEVFSLTGETQVVGRSPQCSISLKDSGVGREHCEIYRIGEMFFIRDLNSRNGTYVNSSKVMDELLREGDEIKIGQFTLLYEESRVSKSSESSEPEITLEDFQDEHDWDDTVYEVHSSKSDTDQREEHRPYLKQLGEMERHLKEPNQYLNEALEELAKHVKVTEILIYILEEGKLKLKAFHGEQKGQKLKVSKTIANRAIREKALIQTTNAMEDFRFKSAESVTKENIYSVMCMPMRAFGRTRGVIYFSGLEGSESFSSSERNLVELIGGRIAVAYSGYRATLRRVTERLNVTRMLNHLVETRIPQLKGRGERVARLARILAHQCELSTRQVNALMSAAYLHHVGYIKMPIDTRLSQREMLDDYSYIYGSVEILRKHGGFADILGMIQHHRARLDGSGYPSVFDPSAWIVEVRILALAVELDFRINLPILYQRKSPLLAETAIALLEEKKAFGPEILLALEKALKSDDFADYK